ncbi:TRAP transporter large permease [bacterium]|nr:TRAP transporter large permease [bacterium]
MPLTIIPARVFNSVDSFAFLAIPAFIYSGDVMALGGITTALITWVRALTGRLKGSIAATTVITSALFGTISGSSVATVSAIGGMMLPEMEKAGYDKKYATALIAASGFLGILIPPSIPGVVYALAVGLPVGDVWLATAIPGVLLTLFYCVYNRVFYAHQERQETGDFNARIYARKVVKSSARGMVALLMPIIIFVGVYGGIMTPTEAGAVAVAYGLLAGWVIYPLIFKDKAGEGLISITKKSAVTSAAIMLLIAFAAIPSAMFTYGDCATAVTDWLFSITKSPTIFLLMVNAVLLIVGMFMETNTSILLLAPILAPAAQAYGVHPIHFSAIMLLNLEIGMITPPFACNIFVACRVANLSMDKVLKPIMGLIAVCIPTLLITTYVPVVSLFFVKLMGH